MLTTTGAKSGKVRTVPVLGVPEGDGVVVFVSGYGKNSRLPAWYHHLRANPEARATVHGVAHRILAHEAEGDERDRLWRKGVEIYPGFADYQRRIPGRTIPVMVLSLPE